jgi:ABC-type amino acid transport substrate-binding protein
MDVPRRLASLSVLLATLVAGPAGAEQTTLRYFNLPPFSYEEDGQPAGPAPDLAQSLAAGLGIALSPASMPLRRLEFEARAHPIVIAAIFRSAPRETSYQWIGRICTDAFMMVSRAPNGPIDSLDEARKLKSIAVVAGATNETFLREQGFTNLDLAASIELEVRRVAEGHDDAWFAPHAGAIHAWKAAGLDPSQLRFGAPIAPMPVWMAASPSVPASIVEELRARFAERAKAGALAAPALCTE